MDFSPGISYFFGQLSKAFLSPGSHISLLSLFSALGVAVIVLAARRYKKGRRIRLKTLFRALFPKRIVLSKSSFADVGYFYFNVFVFGIIFGWALLSYDTLEPRYRRSSDKYIRRDAAGAAARICLQIDHHHHAVPGL